MKQLRIYVWGFPASELKILSPLFEPVEVSGSAWPSDVPVFVHGHAWKAFRQRIDAGAFDDRYDAVLYLPLGMEEPEDAWAYFDDTVRAGNLGAVEDIIKHPARYLVQEFASEVPSEVLDQLHRPGYRLDPDNLALPAEVRVHLQDEGYRVAFEEAVRRQQIIRSWAVGFSKRQLEDYVNGLMDDETRKAVELFLEVSPSGRAIMDQLLEGPSAGPVINAEVKKPGDLEAALRPLESILLGLAVAQFIIYSHQLKQHYKLRKIRTKGGHATSLGTLTPENVLKLLQQGEPVTFEVEETKAQFKLALDTENEMISIYEVKAASEVAKSVFWVEMNRGNETVLRKHSREGRVLLSLTELASAFEQGASHLAIVAAS